MNQNKIEELEKAAKAGNADAQYLFGDLLVLNGYYDDGSNFLTKAAANNQKQAIVWVEYHKKLIQALKDIESDMLNPKLINVWDTKKGDLPDKFGIMPLSNSELIVLIQKDDIDTNFKHYHSELISEKYFHIMFARWKLYLDGVLKSKDIKPTKNAKYLISIIHFIIENNPELKWW